VAAGEEIVLSRHGVPLARLVPIDRQLRRKRLAAIERLQGFAAGRRLDGLRIAELRDEERRW
jgi:prevent-host-death family protein